MARFGGLSFQPNLSIVGVLTGLVSNGFGYGALVHGTSRGTSARILLMAREMRAEKPAAKR